eukprot:Clim_evm5s105 gene=Clim_evmTU5s105
MHFSKQFMIAGALASVVAGAPLSRANDIAPQEADGLAVNADGAPAAGPQDGFHADGLAADGLAADGLAVNADGVNAAGPQARVHAAGLARRQTGAHANGAHAAGPQDGVHAADGLAADGLAADGLAVDADDVHAAGPQARARVHAAGLARRQTGAHANGAHAAGPQDGVHAANGLAADGLAADGLAVDADDAHAAGPQARVHTDGLATDGLAVDADSVNAAGPQARVHAAGLARRQTGVHADGLADDSQAGVRASDEMDYCYYYTLTSASCSQAYIKSRGGCPNGISGQLIIDGTTQGTQTLDLSYRKCGGVKMGSEMDAFFWTYDPKDTPSGSSITIDMAAEPYPKGRDKSREFLPNSPRTFPIPPPDAEEGTTQTGRFTSTNKLGQCSVSYQVKKVYCKH